MSNNPHENRKKRGFDGRHPNPSCTEGLGRRGKGDLGCGAREAEGLGKGPRSRRLAVKQTPSDAPCQQPGRERVQWERKAAIPERGYPGQAVALQRVRVKGPVKDRLRTRNVRAVSRWQNIPEPTFNKSRSRLIVFTKKGAAPWSKRPEQVPLCPHPRARHPPTAAALRKLLSEGPGQQYLMHTPSCADVKAPPKGMSILNDHEHAAPRPPGARGGPPSTPVSAPVTSPPANQRTGIPGLTWPFTGALLKPFGGFGAPGARATSPPLPWGPTKAFLCSCLPSFTGPQAHKLVLVTATFSRFSTGENAFEKVSFWDATEFFNGFTHASQHTHLRKSFGETLYRYCSVQVLLSLQRNGPVTGAGLRPHS